MPTVVDSPTPTLAVRDVKDALAANHVRRLRLPRAASATHTNTFHARRLPPEPVWPKSDCARARTRVVSARAGSELKGTQILRQAHFEPLDLLKLLRDTGQMDPLGNALTAQDQMGKVGLSQRLFIGGLGAS